VDSSSPYECLRALLGWPETVGALAGRILIPLTTAALASALCLVPLSNASAGAADLKAPRISDLSRAAAFRTTTLTPSAQRRLDATSFWGGPTTASTGEAVTVFVSNTYPMDPATQKRWAYFLASLLHGTELSLLNAYLMPLSEVQSYCGAQALACYSTNNSTLIAPGDDPATDTSAEAVVAHEYGHHVAAHRSNAPWPAVDYGTKRWASYEQVCQRTASGELHPGAETVSRYQTNPGEAYAETFRVLNERRLGLPETPWDIVTTSLYPDASALALVEQDVTQPWTADTTTTYRGTSGRRYTIATALDGPLAVKVSASKRTKVRFQVGASVATTTTAGGSRSAARTVCGSRTLQVRVTRVAGKGGYTLAVAKP
jgi:hypothetical protein